jgi:hypothetical protein
MVKNCSSNFTPFQFRITTAIFFQDNKEFKLKFINNEFKLFGNQELLKKYISFSKSIWQKSDSSH